MKVEFFSFSCISKWLFGLMVLSLIGTPVSRAQQTSIYQITPGIKFSGITISLTGPPKDSLIPGMPPVEYFEAKEPVKSGNGETYAWSFPSAQMTFMRVEVVESEDSYPPIGTLLIYQEGKMTAACRVASIVESKPDPSSKKDASSSTRQYAVFEFCISSASASTAKFEIERYSRPLQPIGENIPILPSCEIGWFYVKDFLPKP